MAMGGRKRSKGSMADINVTPFIDILLVLLIIFMVIQPNIEYDLEARVPSDQTEELDPNVVIQSDAIVVSIESDGSYRINQDPVGMGQLGSRLFDIFSARANKNMFVQAESNLPFGDIVRVIDIAKGAGVGDVGLMTKSVLNAQ